MRMRFLHTADWQIGKPFQSVEEPAKREALRKQRVDTVRALRALIDRENPKFVVVSGDAFDSFTPDAATVSAFCSAAGELELPVYLIPGNHDSGAPGCIWEQSFFQSEAASLCPNLSVLLEAAPVVREDAVLLPCPLASRRPSEDPTAWLRRLDQDLPADRPRIVIAHGSVHGFSSSGDNDAEASVDILQLNQLPPGLADYIALGDWHGTKQVLPNAWYSGTPEQDRFARGDNNPGNVLLVALESHGTAPEVKIHPSGEIGWHELDFTLASDDALTDLEEEIRQLLGARTGRDLLKLRLEGSLSLEGESRFARLVEQLEARLIELRLERRISVIPSREELDALVHRNDPIIATVASELSEEASAATETAAPNPAKEALALLFKEVKRLENETG
ncbi:MAG: exonuclease SbcCD subunit D [Opitutales bacterium]